MRQLLVNIFFFLVAITLFCLAAPQIPAASANRHSAPTLIAKPVKTTPKDSASLSWKKENPPYRGSAMLSEKAEE